MVGGRVRGVRVVGGSLGGRRLVVPQGLGTRPTTDRTKESVFASLGPAVLEGATVLDLFAGSGALGIEALSRGAVRALFVDRSRSAGDVVRRNLAAMELLGVGRVVARDAWRTVHEGAPPEAPFSLVFLDPPYDVERRRVVDLLVALDQRAGWLDEGARAVVERPARDGPALVVSGWRSPWSRTFGDTLISFMVRDRCAPEEMPP